MSDNAVFVLVHSPLLGPSSWRWVARELRDRGRRALVPLLLRGADVTWPTWREVCGAVNAASPHRDTVVLVGHSGAGTLLPTIAESFMDDVAGLVFVDAFLPPSGGAAGLVPAEFVDRLRALASGDVLPPWSTWFGEAAMRDLVPDDARRAEVEADMPRVPLSSLLAPVPIPERWERYPCAYVLLSVQPYAASAAEARARGWPVAEIADGNHLDSVRRPTAVTDALLAVEASMAGGG
jgi:pimeloyl-ACP methyl ester carboxylesterase